MAYYEDMVRVLAGFSVTDALSTVHSAVALDLETAILAFASRDPTGAVL